jgi:cathepsin A (carboxypeptidase C)
MPIKMKLPLLFLSSLGILSQGNGATVLRGGGDSEAKGTAWIEDLIEQLPDFGKTPTPHFSGFLDGAEGCDTETNGPICQIHYWLALAEQNASTAPIVLWLNGGPGSSSLLGFLQEEGPLLINAKGLLMKNPYSWTKYVNLLAIEAPIGVGFSYCSRQMDQGKPCKNTDRFTASTSRAALVDFFSNKFPEFAKNEFFISGESYAGVYIPTLTKEILDHTDINLKGIAVGDPCTDNVAQKDSMDSLWYAHKNGLVDDEIYDLLWNQCSVRLPNLMTRGGVHHVVHELNQELKGISDLQERNIRAEELYHEVVLSGTFQNIQDSPECTLAMRKFQMSSSNGLSQSWRDLYVNDYSLFSPVSGLEDEQMAAYMSRQDVREALHVDHAPTTTWPNANVGFDYFKEYDACNWQDEILLKGVSMIDIYKEIVPKLERTWIYNGDTDPCVSYEGTRLAVKQIMIDELDGGSYRPWFYNQTAASLEVLAEKSALYGPNLVAQDMGPQFGGEVTDYELGLKFITFHGSGHMVPQFRPQAALHFIQKFVAGGTLSPLMPLNATMIEMSEHSFQRAYAAWTESAMTAPYVQKEDTKHDNGESSITAIE